MKEQSMTLQRAGLSRDMVTLDLDARKSGPLDFALILRDTNGDGFFILETNSLREIVDTWDEVVKIAAPYFHDLDAFTEIVDALVLAGYGS